MRRTSSSPLLILPRLWRCSPRSVSRTGPTSLTSRPKAEGEDNGIHLLTDPSPDLHPGCRRVCPVSLGDGMKRMPDLKLRKVPGGFVQRLWLGDRFRWVSYD